MTDTTKPATPGRFGRSRPKVPPFARFVGTSAWRKDHRRAKEYALYLAAQKHAKASVGA